MPDKISPDEVGCVDRKVVYIAGYCKHQAFRSINYILPNGMSMRINEKANSNHRFLRSSLQPVVVIESELRGSFIRFI